MRAVFKLFKALLVAAWAVTRCVIAFGPVIFHRFNPQGLHELIPSKHLTFWTLVWAGFALLVLFLPELCSSRGPARYGSIDVDDEEERKRRDQHFDFITPGTPDYIAFHAGRDH